MITYHLHNCLFNTFFFKLTLSFYLNAYFGYYLSGNICELTALVCPLHIFFLIHIYINTTIKID